MSTGIVLTFLTLLLAGVLLILLGRRGRKINDHPQCTWCGFDLVGVYPAAVTCPECGAGLARTHGQKPVRQGVRVRQPILIATGLTLVLIAAAPLGLFTYAAITGTPIAKHLPVRGLELMANLGNQTRADEAAAELTDRLLKKSLDPEESSRAVALVLAYQADATRPWTRPWADLLERINLDNLLSPEQGRQVIANAIRPMIQARPMAARGRATAVEITPGTPRLATNQNVTTQFFLRNWRINGTQQPIVRYNDLWMLGETPPPLRTQLSNNGWWELAGPESNPQQGMRFTDDLTQPRLAGTKVRRDTPLGIATLSVEIDLQEVKHTGYGMQTTNRRDKPERTLVLSVPIQIVDTPDEAVRARTLTGAELEAFQKALNLSTVYIDVSQHTYGTMRKESISLAVSLHGSDPWYTPGKTRNKFPDGAAFDAEVEIEGETYRTGQVVEGRDNSNLRNGWFWSSGDAELLQVPKAQTATIRLKPNRELAEAQPHMTWFHNAEMVLNDVPISIRDYRPNQSTPLSELRATSMQERMMPGIMYTPYGSTTYIYPQSTNPDDTDPEDQPTNP